MKRQQPTGEVQHLLSVQDTEAKGDHHNALAGHGEEREITRMEMWIDALAGIVVTLTVLSLMEALNEPQEERIYLAFLVLTLAIGFILMATVLTNTYLAFQWLGERAAHDPAVLALGLAFVFSLSLFTFGLQSLMQSFLDQSAIYFFGGIFVAINLWSLFLFLYSVRVSDLSTVAGGRSAIYHELAYYVGTIAIVVGVVIASPLVPSGDQTYVFLASVVGLVAVYIVTRTNKALSVMLPEGFPRERIDLFTDGVYAVAVTLFLIEIKYPSASHDHSESLAMAFLREEWRAVVGQFVSFAVLGVHWYLQNYLSAMTRKPTSVMFSIALGHCMGVALFPFTVKLALLSEFRTVWRVATPLMCYSMLALTQLLLWFRARGTISDKVAMYICRGALGAAWLIYLVRDLV